MSSQLIHPLFKDERRLLRRLSSLSQSRRKSALIEFAGLPADQKSRLLHVLLDRYPNALFSVIQSSCWCVILPVAFSTFLFKLFPSHWMWEWMAPSAIAVFALLSTCLHWQKENCRLRTITALLDHSSDLKLIPLALKSLARDGEPLFMPLTRFLARNLPRVTENDAETWSYREQTNVLSILTAENTLPVPLLDEDLRYHSLDVLLYIGQWRQLQALTEVTLGFHYSTPRLKARSAEIIPLLLRKLVLQEQGETLLRSAQPPLNPDSLLRIPENSDALDLNLLRPT